MRFLCHFELVSVELNAHPLFFLSHGMTSIYVPGTFHHSTVVPDKLNAWYRYIAEIDVEIYIQYYRILQHLAFNTAGQQHG